MKMNKEIIAVMTVFLLVCPQVIRAQETSLDVPYYEQGKDTPWADELLGNKSSLTIRTHGCALTCISMMTSFFEENQMTPSDMNNWLKSHNGFHDGWEGSTYLGEVNLNWPSLSEFEQGYVYTRHDWAVQAADLQLIRYYIDKGIPVISEVLYRGAPHYVVLTGYKGDDFIMNDPEFPDHHNFNEVYNISDKWGSGPARNIYGIRVLYPAP
jgi:hypothetical protein